MQLTDRLTAKVSSDILTKARLNKGKTWLWAIFRLFLFIGIGYVILYPILYMLSTTFRSDADILDPSIVWIPKHFSLNNIKQAFDVMEYPKALANTAGINMWRPCSRWRSPRWWATASPGTNSGGAAAVRPGAVHHHRAAPDHHDPHVLKVLQLRRAGHRGTDAYHLRHGGAGKAYQHPLRHVSARPVRHGDPLGAVHLHPSASPSGACPRSWRKRRSSTAAGR